nr:M67 family metallopeptidase [Novosphingobium sp. IK01]
MVEAALRAFPAEACGLLLGKEGHIMEARACANVAPDPLRHFEIDPAALIAAHRASRAGGLAVLGYFHSHPNGLARPSATDARAAAGDGRIWAIIALTDAGPSDVGPSGQDAMLTLWRDTPSGFEPLSYRDADG